ncbi:lipocalin family protein [uncultured Bacteroides sp.]|uniref:lipocalin family protein n=1 Tax=uncultured Bacteroides sp. TaxID=162156 RepID=UPI0025E5A4BC|nr:lipocalin family protein [uncultured Bacteroides sp.]
MSTKTVFKCAAGLMATAVLVACNATGIEGKWVEPVPGMENQVQGVNLEKGGKASSVNMATLQYESWEKKDGKLILSGKSIGNHQTIDFIDTLVIEKLTVDELVVKQGDLTKNYRKQ